MAWRGCCTLKAGSHGRIQHFEARGEQGMKRFSRMFVTTFVAFLPLTFIGTLTIWIRSYFVW